MPTNDRRAIEAALPSRLFLAILMSIRGDPDNPSYTVQVLDTAMADLETDIRAALAGGNRRQRHGRLSRAMQTSMGVLGGKTRATALLALTYWVAGLISEGHMTLTEGSPFERAYTAVVRIINADPTNTYLIEVVEKSATKAAHRLHETLTAEGYFR